MGRGRFWRLLQLEERESESQGSAWAERRIKRCFRDRPQVRPCRAAEKTSLFFTLPKTSFDPTLCLFPRSLELGCVWVCDWGYAARPVFGWASYTAGGFFADFGGFKGTGC